MSIEQWFELERLCRQALEALDELGVSEEHDITRSLKLTGAFAAAIQNNMKTA